MEASVAIVLLNWWWWWWFWGPRRSRLLLEFFTFFLRFFGNLNVRVWAAFWNCGLPYCGATAADVCEAVAAALLFKLKAKLLVIKPSVADVVGVPLPLPLAVVASCWNSIANRGMKGEKEKKKWGNVCNYKYFCISVSVLILISSWNWSLSLCRLQCMFTSFHGMVIKVFNYLHLIWLFTFCLWLFN